MVSAEFLKSLHLGFKKLRSSYLSLDDFVEIVEKEFLREYKKETKVALSNVGLVILVEDEEVTPALYYLFDNYHWVVRFDKTVERASFRYADDHFSAVYYQAKLKDGQIIEYGVGKRILFQNNKKGIVFYDIA